MINWKNFKIALVWIPFFGIFFMETFFEIEEPNEFTLIYFSKHWTNYQLISTCVGFLVIALSMNIITY